MTIEKGLIGKEDVSFGTGTFERKSNSGSLIPITKVNASHIPILDSGGKFLGETVEAALAELQVEDAIGSNVADLTNKSGAQRVKGDVVIADVNNDDSFTTTTTSGHTKVIGVVGETIANNATGQVITAGYMDVITVDSVCARGSFLKSSTSEGKATPVSEFEAGCFALTLTASGGPGTVTALIFGTVGGSYLPLTGGSLTGMLKLAKGADIASSAALTLGNDGNYFDVTGSTNITSINTKGVGTFAVLHFDSTLSLIHSIPNLLLPGGVDLGVINGTEVGVIEYSAGAWRVVSWTDAGIIGTGSQVRAINTVLVTPTFVTNCKTDTIVENTPANGVTIDGLNLKDGKLNTTDSVVETNLTGNIVSRGKLATPSPGNYAIVNDYREATTTSTVYTKLKEIKLGTGGTFTVSFYLHSDGVNTVYGRVYKNGSAFGTEQSTVSGGYVLKSENLTFADGDLIQLYCYSPGGVPTVYVREFALSVDSPLIAGYGVS